MELPEEWVSIGDPRLQNRATADNLDFVIDSLLIARIHLQDAADKKSAPTKTLGVLAAMITAVEAVLGQVEVPDVYWTGETYIEAIDVKGLLCDLRTALDTIH